MEAVLHALTAAGEDLRAFFEIGVTESQTRGEYVCAYVRLFTIHHAWKFRNRYTVRNHLKQC